MTRVDFVPTRFRDFNCDTSAIIKRGSLVYGEMLKITREYGDFNRDFWFQTVISTWFLISNCDFTWLWYEILHSCHTPRLPSYWWFATFSCLSTMLPRSVWWTSYILCSECPRLHSIRDPGFENCGLPINTYRTTAGKNSYHYFATCIAQYVYTCELLYEFWNNCQPSH